MSSIFNSSIGRKLMMSIMGLFLILFLIVHLGINLLVLFDSPRAFNIAADFMTTNLVIKVFELILFGSLLLHIIYGVILQIHNWIARPERYKKTNHSQTSFFSKYMFHTAVIIFVFLFIHLLDFYFKSKFFEPLNDVVYNDKTYYDMAGLVIEKFKIPGFVIGYILSFLFLGFHLLHGFQSAFQTLGINHKVYSPIIKKTGIIYTWVITIGFTFIPVYVYFFK